MMALGIHTCIGIGYGSKDSKHLLKIRDAA